MRYWSDAEDAALVAAVRAGATLARIAEQLSDTLGVRITRKSAERRLSRLIAAGVQAARPAPTSAPETSVIPEAAQRAQVATTAASTVSSPEQETIRRLVGAVRARPVSFEALCDALDLAPRRLRELVASARAAGYRVDVDGDHVGRPPAQESVEAQTVHVSGPEGTHLVAVVGDVHFGSRHHLREPFRDFCRMAYARGARTFLQVGDLLDGVYRHSIWEQDARGYEEQVAIAIRELPAWPDATWHFIAGNHEDTIGEQSGLDVGRAVEQSFRASGRQDLVYHGDRGAYLRLRGPGEARGLLVELWHPRDRANAYAKSYRLQKKIEKYAPGQKPDLLCAGHWHQSMFMTTRGVHAISAGCWQGGQSAFGKSLGGAPDIGSWIVEYAMTAEGTVRCFKPEWIAYFERETVRDVGLG